MSGLDYLNLIIKEKKEKEGGSDVECPSIYEELQQLWKEWDLNDEDNNEGEGEDESQVTTQKENNSQPNSQMSAHYSSSQSQMDELFSQDLFASSQSSN